MPLAASAVQSLHFFQSTLQEHLLEFKMRKP
jgi:hypothetical protein